MNVRLVNPTGRRTEARLLYLGRTMLYFSYETCIGFQGFSNGVYHAVRLDNSWGPTTGRHINDLGISSLPIVDSDEFDRILGGVEAR